MAKKTGFLVGAILGVIGGAVAALATAPKEGKKLRKDVKDFYQDYKEDPKAKFDEVKDTALNFYDEKSGKVVDFSTDKFNEMKEKFDNGEISTDKVKAFLVSKKAEIKAKVDSGELSKEKVMALLAATKDKLSDKVNELKSDVTVADLEDEFALELDQEDLIDKTDEIVDKASDKAVETLEAGKDLLNK
ncbi:hypothetical protein RU86_GL000495 [Lactococcus piscium]|uniref:General stress protein n=1 Tax=Pseudolactococcus piscium TaxID=1364 RepID=A0A2A5RXS0_9LACT|nr:YtxH domain-containing protein [Lactococcus piscium]PCS05990.1 hypothetical protein RU86_GL000495 [Lactococcus piscium]